eukprot:6214529-Pleurochrysis_carterae.AAC.5
MREREGRRSSKGSERSKRDKGRIVNMRERENGEVKQMGGSEMGKRRERKVGGSEKHEGRKGSGRKQEGQRKNGEHE